VGVVASQRAVHGRRGEEYHFWTAMVVACAAGRAGGFRAWDAVLESYSVAWKSECVSDWCSVGRGFSYDMCSIGLDSFFVERKSIS
jgi:hypothetical protein